ncbi:MAG: GGDEF domain-containing protein, partial [Massilia sp.]
GKLFLNVSPECLLGHDARHGETIGLIHAIGIHPDRVIIELTENQPTYDYQLMREAVVHYRAMGFQIAIDDLGEGFSSLRLWSELRPEYVKIDMHFIQGINADPVKLQFVRSIQQIAEQSNTLVIAEGIETEAELLVLRDLRIGFGQGYHLGRPSSAPPSELPCDIRQSLGRSGVSVYPQSSGAERQVATVFKMLHEVAPIAPEASNNEAYGRFAACPALQIIPVVSNGTPLGLISRYTMIEHFARPYQRELHGKKSCTQFMDSHPIIVERDTSLQELSCSMAQADAHHLLNGFIITGEGRYLGMGNSHDLMRELTQLQINAARYANPLTQLPGNVPINEHVERLLASGGHFTACYCDLDHFKPYNDQYGYRRGDDVIELAGAILAGCVDADRDFVGHIGGDDFMLLFQSEDWEARCRDVLARFGEAIVTCYSARERSAGGFVGEDRQGREVFHRIISMSIGAVRVMPGQYHSHHQVAAAATQAKSQAKKALGNSLFVDRREGAC